MNKKTKKKFRKNTF